MHVHVIALSQEFIMHKGKRVSNALYTRCNKSLESNVTSRLAHVTKLRSQILDFPPSRGVFSDFYDRLYLNAHSVLRFFLVFSLDIACIPISLHLKPRPQINI